jgi:subtilisin
MIQASIATSKQRRVEKISVGWNGAWLAVMMAVGPQNAADAGEKISEAVEQDLSAVGRSRVIVIMKRPPAEVGTSAAFAQPEEYLSGVAVAGISNVARLSNEGGIAVAEIEPGAEEALRTDPNVALVVKDEAVPPLLMDTIPQISVDKTWDQGFEGSDQAIVILDTGVRRSHPFLKDRIVAEACFSTPESSIFDVTSLCPGGQRASTIQGAGEDCENLRGCGHGTHVAGIASGKEGMLGDVTFNGVAPAASLISIKVFTRFDDVQACGGLARTPCVLSFTSDQLRALEHVESLARDHKIAAVNMSLGGDRHETPCDAESPLTGVIGRLADLQIATVVASGNDGFFNAISEPACVSKAIAVGAVRKVVGGGSEELAISFSNTSSDVDLLAPGDNVISADATTGSFVPNRGTSMAAPHVAGAWAVLKSAKPDASFADILAALRTSGARVRDPRTGLELRRIDVAAALPRLDVKDQIGVAGASATEQPMPQLPADARRILLLPDPGGPASGMPEASVRESLTETFGAEAQIEVLGPGQAIIENPSGVTQEQLEQAIEQFGAGTKIYEDKLGKPM